MLTLIAICILLQTFPSLSVIDFVLIILVFFKVVISFGKKGMDGVGYTYWGFRHNAREQNKGWRVDHVLVSKSLMDDRHVETCFVRRELLGSDHTAVGILLNKQILTKKD